MLKGWMNRKRFNNLTNSWSWASLKGGTSGEVDFVEAEIFIKAWQVSWAILKSPRSRPCSMRTFMFEDMIFGETLPTMPRRSKADRASSGVVSGITLVKSCHITWKQFWSRSPDLTNMPMSSSKPVKSPILAPETSAERFRTKNKIRKVRLPFTLHLISNS